jgi:hypothetical protein
MTMNRTRFFSVDYPRTIPAVINVSPEAFEEEADMVMMLKYASLGG